jgi:tRNA A37 N6-isopentenylltransferase MiaA
MKKTVIVVGGPTASGKSRFALAYAFAKRKITGRENR